MPAPPEPNPPSPALSSGRTARLEALGRALLATLPPPGPGGRLHIGTLAPSLLLHLQGCLETQAELLLEPGPCLGGLYLGYLEELFAPLQERLDLHGVPVVAFLRGISTTDIQAFFEGLLQEPASLEGRGGLRGYMERSYAQRIQLRAPDSVPDFIPEHLLGEVRETLSRAIAPPDAFTGNTAGWLHLVANLGEFGQTGHRLGLGKGEPEDRQLEVLRRAFADLSPEQVLSLARGLGTLPGRPAGLATAFRRTLPGYLGNSIAHLVGRGVPWLILHDPLMQVVDAFPPPLTELVPALRQGLATIQDEPLVVAFLAEAAWRAVPLQEQLDQARQPGRLMALPEESRSFLLERALKSRRLEEVVDLLGALDEALVHGDAAQRGSAFRTLHAFLPHTASSLAPDYVMDALESILIGAFQWMSTGTPDPALRDCLRELFLARVVRRQPGHVLRGLSAIETHAAHAGSAPLTEAVNWIRRGLEHDTALDAVIECLHQGDRSDALAALQPLLAALGEPFYHRAAWVLGREEDRGRRDRLIRALRAGGSQVEPVVLQMLRPAMPWFHARNLLLVLSSAGSEAAVPRILPFLNHDDPRVRVGALRALRHCAQRKAVPHLINCLSDPNPALQQEAIHLLGQQKAYEGVRPLTQLALDPGAPPVSRLKAIETLGLLESHDAVDPLFELANRRGGFLRAAEADGLRLAAARTLLKFGPEGRARVERTAAKEGRGGIADSFLRMLAEGKS